MTDQTIWDFLMAKTHNAYGTAAIMGNLMAESSMNSAKANTKNKDYVREADDGEIDFVHDGIAFGLVQWCYWSRKQALLDYACAAGVSLADPEMQLNFMWTELQGYKAVFNAILTATNIADPTVTFMLKYERPSGTSEAAKQKRIGYAQKYYDEFAKAVPEGKLVTATANVNIRTGNGTDYTKIGLLKKGERLEYVASSENGWYAVKYKKQVGWVSGNYAEVSG